MASDKKLLVLALGLLILIAFGSWWAFQEPEDRDLKNSNLEEETSLDSPEAPRRFGRTIDEKTEEATTSDIASEVIPIDFDKIDRNLDLFGRITDKSGAPVVGAEVRCFEEPWRRVVGLYLPDGESKAYGASTRTAADGSFCLRLDRGERVSLEVSAASFGITEVESCLAGERVDVVLEPAASLHVQCLAPNGAPAEGVQLRIWMSGGLAAKNHREGETGPDGCLSFVDLSPGVVTLSSNQSSYAPGSWQTLQLSSGETTEARIQFDEGRLLLGQVTDARSGTAVAAAKVGVGWTMRSYVLTNEAGQYSLPVPADASGQEVHVTAGGFGRKQQKTPSSGDLNFALEAADQVRGRLISKAGSPVSGAYVQVVASVSHQPQGQQIDSGGSQSDALGVFGIADLRRDLPHSLVVTAKGFGRYLLDFDPNPKVPGLIDLGDIVLPNGRAIEGQVVDADGVPIHGAKMKLKGYNSDRGRLRPKEKPLGFFYAKSEFCQTDDLGRYSFNDLAPGAYEISHELGSSLNKKRSVDLGPDSDQVGINFRIEGKGKLRFLCLDPDGKAVGSVSISVLGKNSSQPLGSATTDLQGQACISYLPESDCQIRIYYRGDLSTPPSFDLRPDDQVHEIRLFKSAEVSGRVVTPDGSSAEGFLVRAQTSDGSKQSTATKGDGGFRFEVQAGQDLTIEVRGERLDPIRGSYVTPDEGALVGKLQTTAPAVNLNLILEPIATDRELTFRVIDPQGNIVVGAHVDGWPANFRGTTDAEGLFHQEGLSDQQLEVSASPPRASPGEATAFFRSHPVKVIPDGSTVTIQLRKSEVVQGRVQTEDGQSCGNTYVEFMGNDGDASSTYSDRQGNFKIAIPEGSSGTLTARQPGRGARKSASVEVNSSQQAITLILK